jgi:surface protein
MFNGCSKLSGLDVSKWNPSSCTDLSFMFYDCSSLKEIDVSKWDVSKVQNFDHFAAHALLRRKGIENWKITSATNLNALFHNCAEEELDLSGWDTSKVQFFTQMFENSPNLKHIKGLDKWDTSNAVGFDEMFGRCYKLEELDLSSWDTSKAKNGVEASTNGHTTGTFRNFCNDCQNLKWIKLGPNFAVNGDGTNTNAEYKFILPTPSTDYIEGADGNWYALNGDSFAPNAIPDRTANTYYSSYQNAANVDVIVKNGTLIETAKAIKELINSTEKMYPSQFGAAIHSFNN